MAEMTPLEKQLALRGAPYFDRLHESERSVIAEAAADKRFAPGEIICEAGQVLRRLYVVVNGSLVDETGKRMPTVVGAGALLFGIPASSRLLAAEGAGAHCLVLGRAHFHTLLYQCPALILGLLQNVGHGPDTAERCVS